MGKIWSFKIYNLEEFRDWKRYLPVRDRAKIDIFIGRLELIDQIPLPSKLVKSVTGYRKIYEIRITGENTVYRPLGCYGPARYEFTILYPSAIEKGDKFVPSDAPQRALERLKLAFKARRILADYE